MGSRRKEEFVVLVISDLKKFKCRRRTSKSMGVGMPGHLVGVGMPGYLVEPRVLMGVGMPVYLVELRRGVMEGKKLPERGLNGEGLACLRAEGKSDKSLEVLWGLETPDVQPQIALRMKFL